MTDLKICDECRKGPAFRASLMLHGRAGECVKTHPLGDLCWPCVNRQMRLGPGTPGLPCLTCGGIRAFAAYIYLRNGRAYEGFVAVGHLCRKCAGKRRKVR